MSSNNDTDDGPSIGYDHPTVRPSNARPYSESRGHIVFAGLTDEEFIDLVRETLETSVFIETEWSEGPVGVADDVLVIKEVYDDE